MRKFTSILLLLTLVGTLNAQTAVTDITSIVNGKVYNIVAERGTMGASATSRNAISTAKYKTADTSTDFFKWTIYKSEKGNYYIYNIGKEMFLGEQSTTKDASVPMSNIPAKVTFKATNKPATYPVMFKTTDNANCVINHSASFGEGLITWNGGWNDLNDTGNCHKILQLDEQLDDNILETIADVVTRYENAVVEDLTYTVSDIAGNQYSGAYRGYKDFSSPAFTGAFGYTLRDDAWDGSHYTATIDFAYPVSKVGGATNETLLAINSRYIRNVEDNYIKVQTTGVAPVDASCLWAIYPSFDNGAFTFAVMNISTGRYIYINDGATAGHNTKGKITLNENPTMFTLDSEKDFKVSGKNLYLSINSPSRDTDVWLGLHGNTHSGTDIAAGNLSQYTVAIGSAKYATFYAPVAVAVPDGVTAHTVAIDGDWAVLSSALTVIPAYTGVVLYSETPATYIFEVTASSGTVDNNALCGTVATAYVSEDAYVLSIKDGQVGFYKAEMNNDAKTAFLNNHHKAYLPMSAGAQDAPYYSFSFEGTTGIGNVQGADSEAVIYDLTGRRVQQVNKSGIYIVNGKQMLVK